MKYTKNHKSLIDAFASVESKLEYGSFEIFKKEFNSKAHHLLPGRKNYRCEKHDLDFKDRVSYHNNIGTIEDSGVHIKDVFVKENINFEYYILLPKGQKKTKRVVFLFHGLNEKNWDKYLMWGQTISEHTQSAIVFFPIAFHMQRTPLEWSDRRKMFRLSEKRKEKFPNIVNSTLSNVAISMRLHSMPQRIIWSGLQTYHDVIQFITDCKNDKHELIHKNFSFDIFAYSIGGFLAEILKLSNYKQYFSNTKLCLFCAGSVINRISPVSKFILDSEANIALYSYLAEHFNSFLKKDDFLRHIIEEDHYEGKVFHSMLEYQKMREFREGLFREVKDQIYAITLKNDTVIPTFEVINTLQGAYRDIDIKVDEFHFDYPYSHENPFPSSLANSEKIDQSFGEVFKKVGDFFNS